MPIIRHGDLPVSEPFPGASSIKIAGTENNAENLTVLEMTLAPGAAIPLHIHPTHQECIVILEGELEGHLSGETRTLTAGHTILAPTREVHGLTNKSEQPARFLAIFPTNDVQRELV